jgi:topoisomerase-4 subunit A
VEAAHQRVACLALDGRLLVFPLAELKRQANGGRGLTLMDVDTAAPLLSAAPFAEALVVQGSGRGGKPKEDVLRGAALAAHEGKRARKGRKLAGFVKLLRVSAA